MLRIIAVNYFILKPQDKRSAFMDKHTFIVSGMTCQHCVARVRDLLTQAADITDVSVNLMPPRAQVEGRHIDIHALNNALAGTSFELTAMPNASKTVQS